jgi:hypothetical protein
MILTTELDGLPDLSVAREESCPCGAVSIYIDNSVMRGYADITIRCHACLTWLAFSASKGSL